MSASEGLGAAQAALESGNWERALDLLADAGAEAETAAGLELQALAAYGNGEFEAAVSSWEGLYALLLADGDDAEAARAAAMIALYLMMDTGLMAPVRGWLRRAERLLGGREDVPAAAIMALVRTYERFMCGDMQTAGEQAARAIELGTRLDVQPAVVIGRVASARVRILHGDVEEGLDLLDEIAVLLMSGDVDPLTTGMMYCELICAAQGLSLYDRAKEWTEMMDRWRPGAARGGINGRCRVHRAEMLRLSGPCDAAEEEALGACDELRPWMRREFGWPLVELGNIRLRKGDLPGAEEAFLAAHEHAWSPHPGFALLKLAQGDVGAASQLIADAVAHPFAIPSKERPPFGDLCLAPLLEAQAEIAAASGDAAAAREAAEALDSIAERYDSRALKAAASLASARASLAEGDPHASVDNATFAVSAWTDVCAPYETSVARMVLGEAYQHLGNEEAAQLEWRAARAAFEAFGAEGWAERAAGMLTEERSGQSHGTTQPAGRSAATLRRDGDTRTVSFEGSTVILRDLKGFRYLERLLAEPGREFHVLDLVAVESGSLPTRTEAISEPDALTLDRGEGLPALDDQARAAYRRRLAEVDADIEEARALNDLGRLELAEHDRDYLLAELARDAGFAGRHRTVGGTAERARTSVTRSIRYSLARLDEHHPSLAAHLGQGVRTGTYCSYVPDPLAPISWEL